MTLPIRIVISAVVSAFLAPCVLGQSNEETFRAEVEPVLRRHCYACHSHQERNIEAGLTLDWKSGWEKGGNRGPAVIPGDVDGSLLIQAIRHTNPELKMPEEKIPDDEIRILENWIRSGAFDPRASVPVKADPGDWWSLKPLTRPELPASSSSNPIDAFVTRTLQDHQLSPVPEADRRTLIRRLTVDLHGLLPSPEEVRAFENDGSPDAVEKLVDRLLESPRYGERWARHWLDTIHFADSHGFEHDVFRPNAWRFRDYVIQSFNEDLPWSQFIREQLAADVIAKDQPGKLAAIGFLGAGTYDHSAAATAPKNFENLDRDDMVTQTMAAFVSTTANCARCHAHKFDPITQEDYYSLQAVFAGIGKGEIPFDEDPAVAKQRSDWLQLKEAAEKQQADTLLSEHNRRMVEEWISNQGNSAPWKRLDVTSFVSVDAASLERLEDGSILSTGPLPEKETTVVTGTTDLKQVTAIRLDVMTHESLPMGGPGRAPNGNLHLNSVELRVFRPGMKTAERLGIGRATSDFDQEGWTIQHAIDGNLETAWGIHPQEGKPHSAVFVLETPVEFSPGTEIHVLLRQIHGRAHIIGRFMLSVTDGPSESANILPTDIAAILEVPASERSDEMQLALHSFVLRRIAEEALSKLPPPQKLYAAGTVAENERGTIRYDKPRDIFVLRRGDVEKPEDKVGPGALSAISAMPARFDIPDSAPESARRAALGDWLASKDNPLTWRSIANRIWHYHFGKGLCDTPSDFGRMGGLPSHPELLDWLACEMRDHDSIKRLHRLICTSEAYRRSSQTTTAIEDRDSDNRFLARGVRQRLDADTWRDSVLQVSGRLDLKMGGPGTQHFSTRPGAQLTPILDYSNFDWNSPGATRRSIYRVVWRGIADPMMEPMDFPDLGVLSPVRTFSASPLQALTLMNNRFVLHHAELMAERAVHVSPDPDQQVRAAVQWVWQRDPDDVESQQLGILARDEGLATVCRLLLNSNEFLFVD